MVLKLIPNIFSRKRGISTNVFQMRDLNITNISGAPSDNFPEGTLVVNTKDFKLYTRVQAGAELASQLYYKLNESSGTSVADLSGNTHTGTATTGTWVEGKFGNGFNCTTDEIEVTGHADFDLAADFTIQMWIKFKAEVPGEDIIIGRTDGNQASLIVEGYIFEVNANDIIWHMHDGAGATTNTIGNLLDLFTIDEWEHVSIVRDSGVIKFYVNGILKFSEANTRVVDGLTIADDLIIGAAPNKALNIDANVDEIKIWNNARTQEEINRDLVSSDNLVWISTSLIS